MPTAQQLLGYLEATVRDVTGSSAIDPCALSWIEQLQNIVAENLPEVTTMRVGTVYTFVSKGKSVRAICTKQNTKTWVLYETDDSSRPGCRWMLGKGWCTAKNVNRAPTQSYSLPDHVSIK